MNITNIETITKSSVITPIIENYDSNNFKHILSSYVTIIKEQKYYYRYSDIQPDISPSTTIIGENGFNYNIWSQDNIRNEGWNNITHSSWIEIDNNHIFYEKYIQLRIDLN